MTRRLTIVRHGNTFAPGETPRRIGARTDLPLVESGRAQARALGDWFRADARHFDRVLASPLQRTRETATLILMCQPAPPPVENCAWLGEIDHGPDEGRPEDAVIARIGAGCLEAWDRNAAPPPGWIVDARARIAGWQALFASPSPETGETLLVTSNGAARFAFLADAGLRSAASRLPSLKLRTGAWGTIIVEESSVRLEAWDQRP